MVAQQSLSRWYANLDEFELCRLDRKPGIIVRSSSMESIKESAMEGLECIGSRRKINTATVSVDWRTLQRRSCMLPDRKSWQNCGPSC